MAKLSGAVYTSITPRAADEFFKNAPERAELSCKMTKGLYLYKLRKGCSWRYRYIDPAGRRKTFTIGAYGSGTNDDLIPNEAAKVANSYRETGADPRGDKERKRTAKKQEILTAEYKTIGYFLNHGYSDYMSKWDPYCAKMNKSRIEKHFSAWLDRDMSGITRHDVKAWYDEAKKTLAPSTIRRVQASLKSLLSEAVNQEVIAENLLKTASKKGKVIRDHAEIKQQKELENQKKAERRMLTPFEMQGILAGLCAFSEEVRRERRNSRAHGKPHLPDLDAVPFPHWFIPFTHLALHTGMRPGDLRSLMWNELDLKFSKQIVKFTNKSLWVERNEESGRKATEIKIPLNPRILEIMHQWWEQQGRTENGLVFPSPKTGKELDRTATHKPWSKVKQLGCVTSDLDFYCFRHHYISTMIAQGIPLFTVAKLAGHKSVNMIQEHYGHLCPDSARMAVDIVAATFTGESQNKEVVG